MPNKYILYIANIENKTISYFMCRQNIIFKNKKDFWLVVESYLKIKSVFDLY